MIGKSNSMKTGLVERALSAFAIPILVFGLSACAEDQSDLVTWMQTERANAPKPKPKTPEPKKFEPFRYEHGGAGDPFAASKLIAALDRATPRHFSGGQFLPAHRA